MVACRCNGGCKLKIAGCKAACGPSALICAEILVPLTPSALRLANFHSADNLLLLAFSVLICEDPDASLERSIGVAADIAAYTEHTIISRACRACKGPPDVYPGI